MIPLIQNLLAAWADIQKGWDGANVGGVLATYVDRPDTVIFTFPHPLSNSEFDDVECALFQMDENKPVWDKEYTHVSIRLSTDTAMQLRKDRVLVLSKVVGAEPLSELSTPPECWANAYPGDWPL